MTKRQAPSQVSPPAAPRNTILEGDALSVLRGLPSRSVQCVITSPPYFWLRDYGVEGQYGLEPTIDEYLDRMVAVFDEVFRVLKPTGTCWLNIGDAYANDGKWGGHTSGKHVAALRGQLIGRGRRYTGLKPKDLMLIPFRLALALQAVGWYVRSDIIWAKPNPMPESVTDRPTRAHEYIFLLTRSERYYYDATAITEPVTGGSHPRTAGRNSRKYVDRDPAHLRAGVTPKSARPGSGIKANSSFHAVVNDLVLRRNRRSVWTVATDPFPDAHYAVFPTELIGPMVLAGSRPGDLILDPFIGSGTVGVVARQLGRDYLGIELSHEYAEMARRRIAEEGRPVVLKRKQRREMRQVGVTQASLLDVV